jgi:signal transduction histidine kinase/CheY-like chemotaxis protein
MHRFMESGATARAMGASRTFSALRANGEEFPMEASISRVKVGGQQFFTVILRDITERQRLEMVSQRHVEQLQEADRRKDEFLAMLAHELRNPLAPIRNAVHVMGRLMPDQPQLQRARELVDRQVSNLARLVDDLLDVSRISHGQVALRKELVELAGVIESAVETSRPWIEARQHVLHIELPSEPLHLEGDPERLAQIFANLLNNAAKYTPERGRIELEAKAEDHWAVVRVRDNGIGIAPDLLAHVFDLFRQGERGLDRSQGGLGIGLTLVKQLVELHGGEITAQSHGLGQGAEFTVRLPRWFGLEKPAEPARFPTVGRDSTEGLRVLVVDDNSDVAESIAMLLELQGHQVEIANDGPQALTAALRFAPEVVVLDIGLPGMDGYEVARRLRARPATKQPMLLIALTGYGREEDREQALAAGCDHHLIKPADLEELKALIAVHQATRNGMTG